MSRPAHLVLRATALGLSALLCAPLVGALHQHEVDHDGSAHHIEAAHGGHAPAISEADSRLTSGALKLVLAAPAVALPGVPHAPAVVGADPAAALLGPPSRASPGSLRSRAPPA